MRNILYGLAGVAVVMGGLRALEDGKDGELIPALAIVCACVLVGSGAIVGAIEKRSGKRSDE